MVLVDESGAGFGISVDPKFPLQPGDHGELEIDTGKYVVEVANIARETAELRVGLTILGAIDKPADKAAVKPARAYAQLQSIGPLGRVLSAACLAFVVAGVVYIGSESQRVFERVVPKSPSNVRAGVAIDATPNTETHGGLGIEIVNSLNSPDITRALRLNEDQITLRDRIFDDASRSLAELYAQGENRSSESLADESSKLLEQALERYLRMLNRRQIEQLISKMPKSSAKPHATDEQAAAH